VAGLEYLVQNSKNPEEWNQFEREDQTFDGLNECPFMTSNCGLVLPNEEVEVFVSLTDMEGIREITLKSGTTHLRPSKLRLRGSKTSCHIKVKVAEGSFSGQFIPLDFKMRLAFSLTNSIKTDLEWNNDFHVKPFDGFHGVSRIRRDFIREWMNKDIVVQLPHGVERDLIGPRDVTYSEEDDLWGISYYRSLNPGHVGLKA
jgi:hypothetical protein